jgi:hypothetical protein
MTDFIASNAHPAQTHSLSSTFAWGRAESAQSAIAESVVLPSLQFNQRLSSGEANLESAVLPFVVIFLLSGVALLLVGHKVEREAKRSASWPVVAGQLERCEVVELPGIRPEDLSTWQLQLRYSYVVRGSTYHSTRYAFGYGDGRDDKQHRLIADALKRSPQLSIHYNPARPSEAVINTGAQTNLTLLGYAGLAMAAIATLIGLAGHW